MQTVLNGAPNRRGSRSVKTSVDHSNITKHWNTQRCNKLNQLPAINYRTQMG